MKTVVAASIVLSFARRHGCWSGTPDVAWSNRPSVWHLESSAQILAQHLLMIGDVCFENCRTNWTLSVKTIGSDTNTVKKSESSKNIRFAIAKALAQAPEPFGFGAVCVSFGCDPSNLVFVLWVCVCSHRRSRMNLTRSMGVDGSNGSEDTL